MTVADILPNSELLTGGNRTGAHIGLGGLRSADGRAFPLLNVKVRASLAGPCAHTLIEQHFANPFDETLDVTWIFPLPDTGAIVEFELRAGDIRVVGECLERAAAQAAFDAARRDGKRAALVEKEQGLIHTLSLVGLPARSNVIVRFTLVELLPSVDNRFRWHFPTTVAPRYTPGTPVGHSGLGVDADTDLVPNASRLSPPIRLEGGTRLDLEVQIAGPVSTVESSLHAVKLALDAGGVRVAPSARATLNKDFILEFSTADSAAPVTRAWTNGSHTLVLVEPPAGMIAQGLPRDAVFAVDISGSMQGEKLQAAKTALVGALHGLRTGDRFKLIAFDDRVERFATDFSTYNEKNLREADVWIEGLESRGGTEMLEAIQECLAGTTPDGRLRTVLFITDGQSSDEARLLQAVANRKGNAVFFTLGIDTAVNSALLKSLATAGGGVCELCTPHDDIDAMVARLETRFGTPLLSQLKVAGAARPDGQTVFAGRPASLLLDIASASVQVSGTSATGAFAATVTPVPVSFPLGALWAMERVQWLEERLTLRPFEEEALRPEILRIALQWHISSRFTSFVCVDHSTANVGGRRHVVQPTEMPASGEMQADAMSGGAMPMQNLLFSPMPSPMPSPSQSLWQQMEPAQSENEGSSSHSEGIAEDEMFVQPDPGLPMHSRHNTGSAIGSAFSVREVLTDMKNFLKKNTTHTGEHRAQSEAGAAPPKLANAGDIARIQSADGSYGGDVGRTAAAVLVLLLLGHTRTKGDRRRTVQKAAEWLGARATDPRAALALHALEDAEASNAGATLIWRTLESDEAEGQLLRQLLDGLGINASTRT